ncbi:MAG: Flp family type IVb pilin [Defluviicoccus sp.]
MTCRSLFYRLWHDEAGATGVEYGLLLAMIALAILGASTTIGDYVSNGYDGFGDTLAGVSAPNTGTAH